MNRIVVIGSSGSGKSSFGAACVELGYAHLEIDSVVHQADWKRLDDTAARERLRTFFEKHDRWVVDGNYAVFRDLVWGAADSIIWLDLPRRVVIRSLVQRSLRRLVTRETLWNGNRERWREVLSTDPERSVIAWAWTHFDAYREDYERQMYGEWSHLAWTRLRSRAEVNAMLANARRRGSFDAVS